MNATNISRTHGIAGIAAAAAALLLSGCGGGDGSDAARAIRLKYSIFFPPTHVHTKLAEQWAAELSERTGGRVEVSIYAGGSLTKPDKCYQGVVDGITDIGMSGFAYTSGRFPLLEGLDLPLGYPDGATATRVANEMIRKYDPAELGNTHILFAHAHGPGILASVAPIRSLEDFAGVNCRGTGFSAKIADLLGANSIAMPQNDTYEALQKGVVKATFCPIETLKGWKQGEVIGFVTETPAIGYTTTMFVTMNKDRWNSLPDDIKAVFDELSEKYCALHGKAWDEADGAARAMLAEMGKPIEPLSEEETARWRERVRPMLDDFAARAEAKGLPGKAFLADAIEKVSAAGK